MRLNAYGIGNPNDAPWLFVVRVFNRRGDLAQGWQAQAAPARSVATFDINSATPMHSFRRRRISRRQTRSRTLRAEIVG